MGPEDRLALRRASRLEQAALLGHPAVELAAPDRPAPDLGRGLDRLRIAHVGHEPQGALADGEGVRNSGFQAECSVERDLLGATGGTAEALSAQLDLPAEGDEAAGCPAVRLQRPAASTGSRSWEGGLELRDELTPQRGTDLGERGTHRPLE